MKNSPKPSAKILFHSDGAGPPNPDMVRQRADEIARIDGRKEHNEEDWKRAEFELHGHHQGRPEDQENEMIFSGPDMMVYDSGHRVENVPTPDSENIGEELVIEGIEEAVHEQMLEASQPEEEEEENEP